MSDTAANLVREHMEVFQHPLPFTRFPFAAYAEKLGITEDEVILLLRHYLSAGIIRRVAGVLKHDRAGFSVNAMIAMEIPSESCDAAGTALASLPFISHCYRRAAYPDWPYTVYTMVHARSEEEFCAHYEIICAIAKPVSAAVLRSIKEYKKTAFRIPGRSGSPGTE